MSSPPGNAELAAALEEYAALLDISGANTYATRAYKRAAQLIRDTPADVTEIVGREPDVLVPSSRDVTRSVNEGVPIVAAQPRSEAAKAFNSLAELFREPGHGLNGSSPNGGSGRRFRIGKR